MCYFRLKRIIKQAANRLGFDIIKIQVAEKNKYDWLKQLKINTIIDIGANDGKWAKQMSNNFPGALIYSFEPLKDCFDKLTRNSRKNNNIVAFNYALGDTNSKSIIYRSSHISSSSLLKMADLHKKAFPDSKGSSTEKITIMRLDDIASELELRKELFIKIDVQGFEMKVINGGEKTLKLAKALMVEVSFRELYKGQPLFHEVYEKLRELGFEYNGDFESIKNPVDGSILQANAIFINSNNTHS